MVIITRPQPKITLALREYQHPTLYFPLWITYGPGVIILASGSLDGICQVEAVEFAGFSLEPVGTVRCLTAGFRDTLICEKRVVDVLHRNIDQFFLLQKQGSATSSQSGEGTVRYSS